VTAKASLSSIAFVFAHAPIDANAGILTPLARALAVAALLALAATLASWLTRKVFFIRSELMELKRRI
jgi:sulfur relay (sulfurtransferase) DsrF/TusC family protein